MHMAERWKSPDVGSLKTYIGYIGLTQYQYQYSTEAEFEENVLGQWVVD